MLGISTDRSDSAICRNTGTKLTFDMIYLFLFYPKYRLDTFDNK